MGFLLCRAVEHLYDGGMFSAGVCELREVIDRLEVSVDADDLAEVFRLRELLLAKSIRPLREFEALGLYQLSKAASTKAFLEKSAGLSSGDAGATMAMARKLGHMPLTEAAFVDGDLPSGTVRAIVTNVAARLVDRYVAHEADNIEIVAPLTPAEAVTVMQRWAVRAHALADADNDKPPREDGFFHSETLGGRYESKGSFAAETGAPIAKAIEVYQRDNPRDDDTRSPAQKRAEALSDISRFYLDYRHRRDVDPDTPLGPEEAQLAASERRHHHDRARSPWRRQDPRRPLDRPHRGRNPFLHRTTPTAAPRREWRDPQLRLDARVGHRRVVRCRRRPRPRLPLARLPQETRTLRPPPRATPRARRHQQPL